MKLTVEYELIIVMVELWRLRR